MTNRLAPSLTILAVFDVALAVILFRRQNIWPTHRADAMGRAALAGCNRPPVAEAPDQDDKATVGGMIDAERVWANAHRPWRTRDAKSPSSTRDSCRYWVRQGPKKARGRTTDAAVEYHHLDFAFGVAGEA